MSSLRQGVASAVDADVRLALQKMSADFVRAASDDAMDPASAAAAAPAEAPAPATTAARLTSERQPQIRPTRAVAVAPVLRRSPSSTVSPAPATARKEPAPRVQDEELLPGTEGLPLMLRRRPSLVFKEARGKSVTARVQMITTARAALSELHKGAYPTKVARPAGDRTHAIIKGIERMQLTSPAPKKSTSKGKKAKRKLRGGA